jgi:hypothetical protein
MANEFVVGVDVLVEGHCECRYVQGRMEDIEEEQGKLRRHRLEERVPVYLGEIIVGVDLPPRYMLRRHVEYPSCFSECREVKVPRKDDDVENDWDEEEVCGRLGQFAEEVGNDQRGSQRGKMSWWWNLAVMIFRMTARPSAGSQRETLCLSPNKSLAVSQLYWNPPSSFILMDTANLPRH